MRAAGPTVDPDRQTCSVLKEAAFVVGRYASGWHAFWEGPFVFLGTSELP